MSLFVWKKYSSLTLDKGLNIEKIKKMEEVLHPSRRRTIVLIGMMGAGKTTTGFGLAQKLGIKFVDSDKEMEKAENLTTAEIFEKKGTTYFDNIERNIIKKMLRTTKPQVLSIGGNAYDDPEIRREIKEKAISVFVDVDLDVLIRRVERRNNRPLLEGKDKAQTMTEIYNEKYPIYSTTDIVVNTTYLSKDTTINVIMQLISDYINGYGKN
ncbi:MAG: shikimate kinase [Rickettsiales bacterium]|nr:shikimate kinase [Rickettsiales bacterium]